MLLTASSLAAPLHLTHPLRAVGVPYRDLAISCAAHVRRESKSRILHSARNDVFSMSQTGCNRAAHAGESFRDMVPAAPHASEAATVGWRRASECMNSSSAFEPACIKPPNPLYRESRSVGGQTHSLAVSERSHPRKFLALVGLSWFSRLSSRFVLPRNAPGWDGVGLAILANGGGVLGEMFAGLMRHLDSLVEVRRLSTKKRDGYCRGRVAEQAS